jgi:hypothetical protein
LREEEALEVRREEQFVRTSQKESRFSDINGITEILRPSSTLSQIMLDSRYSRQQTQ